MTSESDQEVPTRPPNLGVLKREGNMDILTVYDILATIQAIDAVLIVSSSLPTSHLLRPDINNL